MNHSGNDPASDEAIQVQATAANTDAGGMSSSRRVNATSRAPAARVISAPMPSAISSSDVDEPHSTRVATSIPGTRNSRPSPTTNPTLLVTFQGRSATNQPTALRAAALASRALAMAAVTAESS